jgi:hypothetical protein
MADDDSHPHQTEPLHVGQSPAERRDKEIVKRERFQLAKLAQAIKLADFMAILMVLATIFSAFATWRTAEVTSLVFAVAYRPVLGVEKVAFDAVDSSRPTIRIDFRNFSQIAALDAIVDVHAVVEGKVVKPPDGEMSAMNAGILSPTVPHFFYAYLTPDLYQAVAAGKSNLQVHVKMLYKGPAHVTQYCYFERLVYDFRARVFNSAGGSDRCGTDVF